MTKGAVRVLMDFKYIVLINPNFELDKAKADEQKKKMKCHQGKVLCKGKGEIYVTTIRRDHFYHLKF